MILLAVIPALFLPRRKPAAAQPVEERLEETVAVALVEA